MAKCEGEVVEGKSDGLEIVSIGSLYQGVWDKKYWSSTRGKDRFPYPVGYKAVRAYNGSTYKMEIQEGHKGPHFSIMYSGGHSCSGQTPDIAWEKFQKTGLSQLKIWNGKRFSCTIDGVEFFGFKNPLVQRMLRELMANINGTAEISLLPSSSRRETSKMQADSMLSDACNPDLLPFLVRPKKRSRRAETKRTRLSSGNGWKKPKSQKLLLDFETSNSSERNEKNIDTFYTSKGENDPCGCRLRGGSSSQTHLNALALEEEQCLSSENGLQLKHMDLSINPRDTPVPARKENRHASSDSCRSQAVSNLYKEFDKFGDFEDKGACSALTIEGREGNLPVLKGQDMNEADLFAPDTLDSLQDAADESAGQLKEELTTINMIVTEGLIAEPHSEETAISNLKMSSGKNDYDSAGQEIAESMMSLLLPQAVPLLKNASRRKHIRYSPLETANNHSVDIPVSVIANTSAVNVTTCAEDEDNIEIRSLAPDLVVPNLANTVSIIPDSFDWTQLGIQAISQMVSSSKETYPANFDHTVLNEKIRKDNLEKSQPVLVRLSPRKHVPSEGSWDPCSNVKRDSIQIKNHSTNKDSKNTPGSLEGKNVGTPKRMHGFTQDDDKIEKWPTEIGSDKKVKLNVYARKKVLDQRLQKDSDTSSENRRCRNNEDDSLKKLSPARRTPLAPEVLQMISANCKPDKTDSQGSEIRHKEQQSHSLAIEKNSLKHTILSNNKTAVVPQKGILSVHGPENISISTSSVRHSNVVSIPTTSDKEPVTLDCLPVPAVSHLATSPCDDIPTNAKEFLAGVPHRDAENNTEQEGIVELLGCYFHPMPISSVLLKSVGDEIYICVSCGHADDKFRTLFVYKVAAKEPRKGCPSFLGHTSALFPSVVDTFGREIASDTSGLQFTPDGQCLILLDSIKTPYCREGRVDCLCSNCTSACEYNAVKIVQVKLGHISVVTKLRMIDNVLCLLMCDPNFVVAVGKSGRLHVWVMNSAWSALVEDFDMPVNHCMSPCIVELKRIPKCAHLVFGHNGLGEFTVWDILKRVPVSSFSSPGISIHQFLPISLFSWQTVYSSMEDHTDRIMAATRLWFSKRTDKCALVPTEGEDTAIWLLVSTASDSDAQPNSTSCHRKETTRGCWRLALLVKNTVFMGSELDPRTAAIGASSGHGVVGTHDGRAYMWDLSNGNKLCALHTFIGCRVSCVGMDDSGSGNLCIASDDGQLMIYLHSVSGQETR